MHTPPFRYRVYSVVYRFLGDVWMGCVWATGLFVVPSLFMVLDRAYAIEIASMVFRMLGVLIFVLLTLQFILWAKASRRKRHLFLLCTALLGALGLYGYVVPNLLANQYAVQKEPMWHVLANILFVVQMICSAATVWFNRRFA